jgi:type I restriction enzyme S subunit
MELKPGYKQTEVGVIPKEWEVKKLSEISPKQSVGLVINPSTYFDPKGSIPMLVGSNVRENRIDAEAANRISVASNIKLAASRLSQGDLVTVRVGDPGVTAVVPPDLDQCNCASMMIVRQDRSFNSLWLCSAMNSRIGRQQVENVQYGTAQKQFNIKDAVNFIYAVPPLEEQKRIAAVLGELELLLLNLEQLIAKKHDIKQAAMQELLTGKRRLPGFEGEWEVNRLGEIANIDPESLSAGTLPDFQFNYISLEDVVHGSLRSYSEQVFESAPSRARRRLRHNDVLISTVRPNLLSHLLFGESGDKWVASTGFSVVRCRPDMAHPGYVFAHLFTDGVNRQIEALLTGSNYPAINSRDVRALEIPLPPYPEQYAIAAVLTDIDAELSALEARHNKTRALKQAMMHELLTGRIRLA